MINYTRIGRNVIFVLFDAIIQCKMNQRLCLLRITLAWCKKAKGFLMFKNSSWTGEMRNAAANVILTLTSVNSVN